MAALQLILLIYNINFFCLRFSQLHTDKKQISVGFIGYPNVGKSSVINTLRSKKVCNVAPLAGETKVWSTSDLDRVISGLVCGSCPTFSCWIHFLSSAGVAVHHSDETHLPHRLPRRRLPLGRQRIRHRSQRSGECLVLVCGRRSNR